MEKREILSREKNFRQINYLVISFSKTIAFTKCLQTKCEKEFLQFPHCGVAQCEKMKNFRQINYLVISVVNPLISRDFCRKSCERKFPLFPHCGS